MSEFDLASRDESQQCGNLDETAAIARHLQLFLCNTPKTPRNRISVSTKFIFHIIWWQDGCWFERRCGWFSHRRNGFYWRSLHSLVSSKNLEWVCIGCMEVGSTNTIHWEVWGYRHQCWGIVRGEWWIDRFGSRSFTSCWRNEEVRQLESFRTWRSLKLENWARRKG